MKTLKSHYSAGNIKSLDLESGCIDGEEHQKCKPCTSVCVHVRERACVDAITPSNVSSRPLVKFLREWIIIDKTKDRGKKKEEVKKKKEQLICMRFYDSGVEMSTSKVIRLLRSLFHLIIIVRVQEMSFPRQVKHNGGIFRGT